MFIPEIAPNLPAGEYPAVLRLACEVCEVQPEQLMSWTVKKDEVILILPDGRKVKFMVVGDWVNPPFPWMVDSPPASGHMPQVGAYELPEEPVIQDNPEDPVLPDSPEEPVLPVSRPVGKRPGKGK